jgi:homoserine acetyltransferase
MRIGTWLCAAVLGAASLLVSPSLAANYPTPLEADWIVTEFKFHTGEVIPALRLHYTTIGDPGGEPVLILHGTGQSGRAMLTPGFAGELFGSGQPLDAARYFREASRDYDPAPGLERIAAPLLAINAADDERNPPETGLMAQALARVRNGHLLLIPASADTRGHGTTGLAKFWQQQVREFLAEVPKQPM